MAQNSAVGGRDGERDFGKGRVERFNANDSIALIVDAKDAEQTLDFNVGIKRPKSEVVAVLVCDSRAFGVELDVNTVALGSLLEEFVGDADGRRERILGVVDSLCLRESTSGIFTWRRVNR